MPLPSRFSLLKPIPCKLGGFFGKVVGENPEDIIYETLMPTSKMATEACLYYIISNEDPNHPLQIQRQPVQPPPAQ